MYINLILLVRYHFPRTQLLVICVNERVLCRYAFALIDNAGLAHLWSGVKTLMLPAYAEAYVQFNPQLCSEYLTILSDLFDFVDGNEGNSINGICKTPNDTI